jgi:hypothetical protein
MGRDDFPSFGESIPRLALSALARDTIKGAAKFQGHGSGLAIEGHHLELGNVASEVCGGALLPKGSNGLDSIEVFGGPKADYGRIVPKKRVHGVEVIVTEGDLVLVIKLGQLGDNIRVVNLGHGWESRDGTG